MLQSVRKQRHWQKVGSNGGQWLPAETRGGSGACCGDSCQGGAVTRGQGPPLPTVRPECTYQPDVAQLLPVLSAPGVAPSSLSRPLGHAARPHCQPRVVTSRWCQRDQQGTGRGHLPWRRAWAPSALPCTYNRVSGTQGDCNTGKSGLRGLQDHFHHFSAPARCRLAPPALL